MRFRDPRSINLTPIWVLMAVNVLVFIALLIKPGAVSVLEVSNSTIANQPWTIVSAMFTHQAFFHILFNMLALYFYGMYVLALIGEARFFIVYFLGGLVGNVLFLLLSGPYAAAIGASGAVFALGGVLVVLVPRLKVMIFPIPVPMDLWIAIIIFAVLSLSPGVAWQAHAGGLVTGLAAGYIFKLQARRRRS